MIPTYLPSEAIVGAWELITCIGTMLTATIAWMFAGR
jgi:hypothetical protein